MLVVRESDQYQNIVPIDLDSRQPPKPYFQLASPSEIAVQPSECYTVYD